MSENSTVNRRFGYNNNRLFIEELPDSPSPNTNLNQPNTNRQSLPAIRDATALSNSQQSNGILVPQRNNNFNNASLELASTQQRVKQLESRIQVTEVSNRALLEEVIRLQNELAISLRRSFDSLQEERNARQLLENNYKFQSETVLQLNGRLKRAEDALAEDRTAMQSLIGYTRNIEQSSLNTQKDLFLRRDLQAQRLEELRMQIDDLQRSKENLERNAYSLLDEIKNLKGRVDTESLNLNSISGDLRNKTKRLEDENRLQLDAIRKQQDSVANTGNNVLNIRAQLESKINEVRDITNDLRTRIEAEKEEKRKLEQNVTIRFGEIGTVLNEEKLKHNETMRTIESIKRDFYLNLEQERTRINSFIVETKDSTLLINNDRIEKAKEELSIKIRDVERVFADDIAERTRFQQNLKDNTDLRLDSFRNMLEDEIKHYRDELKESLNKSSESIKKLNEGLNLIEQQNEEKTKQLEKVISAEIKSRKINEKDYNEKLENYNEKFTYAMQSFQATVGTLSNRITEQANSFMTRKDFEPYEKRQERLQTELNNTELQLNSVKENLRSQQGSIETQNGKIKELNEKVYKVENVEIPALNTRLGQLVNKEDMDKYRRESEQQVNNSSARAENSSNKSSAKSPLASSAFTKSPKSYKGLSPNAKRTSGKVPEDEEID